MSFKLIFVTLALLSATVRGQNDSVVRIDEDSAPRFTLAVEPFEPIVLVDPIPIVPESETNNDLVRGNKDNERVFIQPIRGRVPIIDLPNNTDGDLFRRGGDLTDDQKNLTLIKIKLNDLLNETRPDDNRKYKGQILEDVKNQVNALPVLGKAPPKHLNGSSNNSANNNTLPTKPAKNDKSNKHRELKGDDALKIKRKSILKELRGFESPGNQESAHVSSELDRSDMRPVRVIQKINNIYFD